MIDTRRGRRGYDGEHATGEYASTIIGEREDSNAITSYFFSTLLELALA